MDGLTLSVIFGVVVFGLGIMGIGVRKFRSEPGLGGVLCLGGLVTVFGILIMMGV